MALVNTTSTVYGAMIARAAIGPRAWEPGSEANREQLARLFGGSLLVDSVWKSVQPVVGFTHVMYAPYNSMPSCSFFCRDENTRNAALTVAS